MLQAFTTHSPRAKSQRPRAALQTHPDSLELRVVLNCVHSQFAAKATLLVTAKGQRRIHYAIGVDPHRAGLQTPGKLMGLLDVVGPDGRRQPVDVFVGLLGYLL